MGIYEYFEAVYRNAGIIAQQDEENRVWEMYSNDKEAFADFVAKNNIDLSISTVYLAEDDFTLWRWDMEKYTS